MPCQVTHLGAPWYPDGEAVAVPVVPAAVARRVLAAADGGVPATRELKRKEKKGGGSLEFFISSFLTQIDSFLKYATILQNSISFFF